MRPLGVEFLTPVLDPLLRLWQIGEPMHVQAFIPQPRIARFAVRILVRFARLNQPPAHAVRQRPLCQRPARKLWAVVAHNLHRRRLLCGRLPICNPNARYTRPNASAGAECTGRGIRCS